MEALFVVVIWAVALGFLSFLVAAIIKGSQI